MTRTKLSRRAVLRGAGTIAIGLPWLEAMGDPPHAHAGQRPPAHRFVTVYTPGGTVYDNWRPAGGETDFELSPILAPLSGVRDHLLILDGLALHSAVGEQHQAGIVAWLTGTKQSSSYGDYASGPSVDQVIASHLARREFRRKTSLQMAMRWATGKSYGKLHPINAANYEDDASANPIPPRIDPVEIWNNLFGSIDPGADTAAQQRIRRKKSILDYLEGRYRTLAARLGREDRHKLEQHLDKIREIEADLDSLPTDACTPPELVDTSDYDPHTGLNSNADGSNVDESTDAAIPKVGRLMMDMLVMALACDITNVASFQWSDTEAKHTFPWLDLFEHHHYYQHDGGFRPNECTRICRWYSEQHAYLLEQMASTDMGGHSLLDESVVFFGSELSEPPTHNKRNMPFLLAGHGGGLRAGRFLRYNNESHNKLLVSLCHLFGDHRPEFGDLAYSDGPLDGLT
ncbi:MAG: DUF1552 domain-containing protein [Myxococcales bacterium FL481]|nr:MAG: DUF1552 domain-containing protein [Myxococcales bacterium FL481]